MSGSRTRKNLGPSGSHEKSCKFHMKQAFFFKDEETGQVSASPHPTPPETRTNSSRIYQGLGWRSLAHVTWLDAGSRIRDPVWSGPARPIRPATTSPTSAPNEREPFDTEPRVRGSAAGFAVYFQRRLVLSSPVRFPAEISEQNFTFSFFCASDVDTSRDYRENRVTGRT